MTLLRRFVAGVRAMVARDRHERELDDELRAYVDAAAEQHARSGMSPAEALRTARAAVGSPEAVKDAVRDVGWEHRFETAWRDVRHGARLLRKNPGFATAAILTLGLGVGVNTAMFSVVNTLLLQPAPYPDPDRLVRVYRTASQSQTLPHSLPNVDDTRDQSTTLASLAAFQFWSYSLAEPGQPAEHLNSVTASANIFSTLGVQPALGRLFTAEEQQPGRDRVVVLSAAFWRERFGADPRIIGRALRIDSEPVVVIGVLPAAAAYPLFWGDIDVWRPLKLSNDWRQRRDVPWLQVLGRLRPGLSLEQAQAELETVAGNLARQYPDANTGSGLRVVPMQGSSTSDTGRRITWLTLALAGVVLLIACANLANLQLARAAAHARAFAIRVALGAPRAALLRQSLAESLLLACVGGALGVVLALWANGLLAQRIAPDGQLTIGIDLNVLAFALAASVAAGAVVGVVPGWIGSRTDVHGTLKQDARGSTADRSHHRLRHGLVVSEIALTLVLLSAAGLFLRGLQLFAGRDLGWQSAGMIMGSLTLPDNRYPDAEARIAFYDRILDAVSTLPSVSGATLASHMPLFAAVNAPLPVLAEGRPAPSPGREPLAHYTVVGPRFFETLEIRAIEGTLLPDGLRSNSPRVVVINESAARRLWPGERAVGKRLRTAREAPWEEVIGVVRDVRFAADLGSPDTRMHVYRSLYHEPWGYITVGLRSPAPESLAEPLRRAVAAIDPDLPVVALRTVEQAVNGSQNHVRLANEALAAFALLGLVLSAVGLYGVIAAVVVRRTAELGIRLALGASPRDVLGLVVSGGLKLAGIGVALGVLGSLAVASVLRSVAPELPAQTLLAVGSVSVLLAATAIVACWLPARRAMKLDPVIALRHE